MLFVNNLLAQAQQGFGPLQNAGLGIPETGTLLDRIVAIVNIGLTLVGIMAGIFLLIAGVRYFVSQGDEGEAKKAKNAILYTVLGLIVIGLAALVVNFVVTAIGGSGGAGGNGGGGGVQRPGVNLPPIQVPAPPPDRPRPN